MSVNLYDEVAYPTSIFGQTTPERMAVIARLAGLTPPPVATARVLEIGGGDGMNVIAMAVSRPGAQFVNFDLAEAPIMRGRAWIERLGLANCHMEVLDILDAAERLQGKFDYIIAHGVYAWVPPVVRDSLMALIADKLSAHGVAFISYNALPGGYLRLALRSALLAAVEGAGNESELRARAIARLEQIANPSDERPNAFQLALRDAAMKCLSTRWEVLRHDELGPCFYPQSLRDVVESARDQGLAFLGDADRDMMHNAFLPEQLAAQVQSPDADRQLLHHLADDDHRQIRFFRQTLLVRDSARPKRALDTQALGDLFVTTQAEPTEDNHFRLGPNHFEVRDPMLSEGLARVARIRPQRLRASVIADTPDRRMALFQMFDEGLIDLFTEAAPSATELPPRPRTSPLARMMLEDGMLTVCTLDHRLLGVTEEDPRQLLLLLDGSHDVSLLLQDGPMGGLDSQDKLDAALAKCLREGLLMPDQSGV